MPQKGKLNFAAKVVLVRRYIAGEISITMAACEAGVDRKTVYRWIARYEAEGAEGFLPRERNCVYSPELKMRVAADYLSGQESALELSKRYKISDPCLVEAWVKKYNVHGDFYSVKFSGGGSYMKQGRDTTQEERIQIVRECLTSGKNYGEMALKYKVSYQQIRSWTLRYEEMGASGLEDRRGKRKKDQAPRTEFEKAQIEIERLKEELRRSKMECGLLKKLNEVVRRDASHK